MDYEAGRKIGAVGEAMVADVIRGLQEQYGFAAYHDVLVEKKTAKGSLTAQLDHVIVDQFGVLIVETKVRNNALLLGRYMDSNWMACYPGKVNKPFQNPLQQNDQHISLLHQLLSASWPDLLMDQVRGLVVFVNADISRLKLDSINGARVIDISDLRHAYDVRRDFATSTPMTPEETAALAAAVRDLDCSGDFNAVNAHAVSRGGIATPPPSPSSAAPRGGMRDITQPSVTTAQGLPIQQTPDGSSVNLRLVLSLLLGGLLVGFMAWAVIGMFNGTAPLWVWIVAFVLVGAFTEESSPKRKRRRKKSKTVAPTAAPAMRLVAAVFMLAMLAAGGLKVRSWYENPGSFRFLDAPAQQSAPAQPTPVQPVSAPPQAVVDVPLAKTKLREAYRALYDSVVDPDAPRISQPRPGQMTYEWDYLNKTSANAVQVRKISITLDAQGQLVGASNSN